MLVSVLMVLKVCGVLFGFGMFWILRFVLSVSDVGIFVMKLLGFGGRLVGGVGGVFSVKVS